MRTARKARNAHLWSIPGSNLELLLGTKHIRRLSIIIPSSLEERSRSSRFTSRERALGSHRAGNWVKLTTLFDVTVAGNSFPAKDQTPVDLQRRKSKVGYKHSTRRLTPFYKAQTSTLLHTGPPVGLFLILISSLHLCNPLLLKVISTSTGAY